MVQIKVLDLKNIYILLLYSSLHKEFCSSSSVLYNFIWTPYKEVADSDLHESN